MTMSRRFAGIGGMRRVGLRSSGRGGGEAVPFSPLDRSPVAWYRETYAAGTWSDLSGNGRDLTQATEGARPTQVTRDGQLALSFDGTDDHVQGSFGTTITQPITIYAVYEPTAFVSFDYVFDSVDSNNRVRHYMTSGTRRLHAGPSGPISGAYSETAEVAIAAVANGASSALYLDDAVTSLAAGDAGSNGMAGLTAGSAFDASGFLTGYIWEIVVLSGADSESQRRQMFEYFASRYASLSLTF